MPTQSEVRSVVEAEFGPVPPEWWNDLVDQAYTAEAERGTQQGMAQLKRRVRDLINLGAWSPSAPTIGRFTQSTRMKPFVPPIAKRGRESAEARVMRVRPDIYSKYLAKMVGRAKALRGFRDKYLSGRSLPLGKAVSLLQSPAVRYLPERDFQDLGIPILGHEARVLEFNDGARDELVYAWTVKLEITVPGRMIVYECVCEVPTDTGKPPRPLPKLVIPINPRQDATLTLFPTSVLDDLRRVTEAIMGEYPWEQAQAVWFVLTGAIPRVAPVEFRVRRHDQDHHSRTLLTMTVEPWLPGDAIKYAYSAIQRRYLGRQRQPGPMNLQVFEFVIDRMSDEGEIPDWDQLVTEWNKVRSSHRRYERWRFVRDFNRAQASIAFFGRGAQPQPESKELVI